MTKKGISNSDVIIVQTNYIKNMLIRKMNIPKEKIFILPNNIISSKICDRNHILNDKIRISMVAKFTDPKRFDIFIKIIKILIDKGLEIEAYLVGDGPNRRKIMKMVDDKRGTFIVTGWIEDISTFLGNMDFNILATDSEGFPNIFLETINEEIPFLCSDIPELRSIVNNKTFLFMNNDQGIMKAAKIIENSIIDNRKYRDLVFISKELKSKYLFNWEKELNRIIKM